LNRLSKEKAQAIAAAYMTNGLKKYEALLSVGYKESYAKNNIGLKLFDNMLVKDAIRELQAFQQAKTNVSIEFIQNEHKRLQTLAESKGDLSTATANIVALGKTIAAYSDKVISADEAPKLSEQQKLEAERIAKIRLSETGS
jgi:hypothetical protein